MKQSSPSIPLRSGGGGETGNACAQPPKLAQFKPSQPQGIETEPQTHRLPLRFGGGSRGRQFVNYRRSDVQPL